MVVKIYALMDGITCLYVGKTKHERKRELTHRNDKHNNCYSRYIPKDIQWTMELIEECEDNIAKDRERYYIEYLQPLYNKVIPGRSRKESLKAYNYSHKQEYKVWREANKEKQKAYYKTHLLKKAQIAQLHPA